MSHVRIDYRMTVSSDTGRVHCGTGLGFHDVNLTVRKDRAGRAFVPGSHVKGIVRELAERLLETIGVASPDPHSPRSEQASLIGQIFGRPGRHDDLTCVFSDARALGDATRSLELPRIKMDRRLGRPAHGALFTSEYSVQEGFGGSIDAWPANEPEGLRAAACAVLVAALRLVERIGGQKSVGAGAVECWPTRIVIDGVEIDIEAALAPLDGTDVEGLARQVGGNP